MSSMINSTSTSSGIMIFFGVLLMLVITKSLLILIVEHLPLTLELNVLIMFPLLNLIVGRRLRFGKNLSSIN